MGLAVSETPMDLRANLLDLLVDSPEPFSLIALQLSQDQTTRHDAPADLLDALRELEEEGLVLARWMDNSAFRHPSRPISAAELATALADAEAWVRGDAAHRAERGLWYELTDAGHTYTREVMGVRQPAWSIEHRDVDGAVIVVAESEEVADLRAANYAARQNLPPLREASRLVETLRAVDASTAPRVRVTYRFGDRP